MIAQPEASSHYLQFKSELSTLLELHYSRPYFIRVMPRKGKTKTLCITGLCCPCLCSRAVTEEDRRVWALEKFVKMSVLCLTQNHVLEYSQQHSL